MNHDWNRLSLAMMYYKGAGYKEVEVPWIVPRTITTMTHGNERHLMSVTADGHPMGDLVGSAEQGFLTLIRTRQLQKGRYVACSPCFRNELAPDDLHKFWFMKVELIAVPYPEERLEQVLDGMLYHAESFFRCQSDVWPDRVETPEGFDLMINGVEVGSYGIRSTDGITWVYGTGLAEPRFSQAIG